MTLKKAGRRVSGGDDFQPEIEEEDAAANPAGNIVCKEAPSQTANVASYAHGLPEHEHYCARISALEAELAEWKEDFIMLEGRNRDLKASLNQCDILRRGAIDDKVAQMARVRELEAELETRAGREPWKVRYFREKARAEEAEARVRELYDCMEGCIQCEKHQAREKGPPAGTAGAPEGYRENEGTAGAAARCDCWGTNCPCCPPEMHGLPARKGA